MYVICPWTILFIYVFVYVFSKLFLKILSQPTVVDRFMSYYTRLIFRRFYILVCGRRGDMAIFGDLATVNISLKSGMF